MQSLAHDIVSEHNKNNVVTVWPLMASLIRAELDSRGFAELGRLSTDLGRLVALSRALGLEVWLEGELDARVG